MVKIELFEVEQWMDKYENTPGVLNIAETCAASVSVDELVALSKDGNNSGNAPGPISLSTRMTYGAIRGSTKLRQHIADLYTGAGLTPENIVVTQGAIAANFLLFYTLVGPGDHVICVYPTYQQLYSVPESLGAEVSLWELKPENGYIPDLSDLEKLIKPNTKLIVINNPNNPTGATTPESTLASLVNIAKAHNITILADEVYSPLYHSTPAPPSILAIDPASSFTKTISTGSMSKSFALAGLRIGWIASRDPDLIEAAVAARDYTTISVSQLDDQVAAYALSPAVKPGLLERNLALARTNLAMLAAFVDRYPKVVEWVKPTAGTTAFIRFSDKHGKPVDGDEFAVGALEEANVLFVPASRCFGRNRDFQGYVRIGYVNQTEVLREGLERLGRYVEKHLM
ncbi:pyridoxal phosphate-dependent transferase [Echria macrotheca]|uniref:Pyridoxal phosphate-dependent transferase n=1 Tax=Echria macrotheca TaxID=438768 RepID=A0AAJ0BK29_9PEZI|nr:pyridoxal phosphate-dependent transferase [Echria macrotheca]